MTLWVTSAVTGSGRRLHWRSEASAVAGQGEGQHGMTFQFERLKSEKLQSDSFHFGVHTEMVDILGFNSFSF